MLCTILLLLVGICAGLCQGEIRQNALESVRWQLEALASQVGSSFIARFQSPSPENDSPDFEAFSGQIQEWLEQYQDVHIQQMGIVDESGRWLAHQNESLRRTPIPEDFLISFEEHEARVISGSELFYSLTPLKDQRDTTVGMLYIGLSKAPFSQKIRQNLIKHFVLFTVLALLLTGGFLFQTRESFLAIHTLIHASMAISSGDVASTNIRIQGIGDVRRLTQAFRDMQHRLHALTLQVQNTTASIKPVSQNLLIATERLAGSLEEQSASIAQISMNMDNVVQASQHISKNTDHVVHIAEKTKNDAQQGRRVAKETLEKMVDIQHSHQTDARNIQELQVQAREISKIMDVIVTIADQTKLIAFNASLEAAGAGKAGRRFSVVANEVRSLADNVIGSTSGIRQRIAGMQKSVETLQDSFESSTARIQQGAEHTTRTAEWLQAILEGTTHTTRSAQKISRSLLKQQLAGEEISKALKEQLASTSEFAKAGAITRDLGEQLEHLTKELEEMISELRV